MRLRAGRGCAGEEGAAGEWSHRGSLPVLLLGSCGQIPLFVGTSFVSAVRAEECTRSEVYPEGSLRDYSWKILGKNSSGKHPLHPPTYLVLYTVQKALEHRDLLKFAWLGVSQTSSVALLSKTTHFHLQKGVVPET